MPTASPAATANFKHLRTYFTLLPCTTTIIHPETHKILRVYIYKSFPIHRVDFSSPHFTFFLIITSLVNISHTALLLKRALITDQEKGTKQKVPQIVFKHVYSKTSSISQLPPQKSIMSRYVARQHSHYLQRNKYYRLENFVQLNESRVEINWNRCELESISLRTAFYSDFSTIDKLFYSAPMRCD